MTGHTYDTPTMTRIRNLMAQLTDAQAEQAAAMANGDDHEFERILTGALMADVWQGEATPEDDAAVMGGLSGLTAAESMRAQIDGHMADLKHANRKEAAAIMEDIALLQSHMERQLNASEDEYEFRLCQKYS